MKHLSKLVLTVLILSHVLAQQLNFNFYPMVQSGTVGQSTNTKDLPNPCSMLFKLQNKLQDYHHIQELLKHYQLKNFGCKTTNLFIPSFQETYNAKDPQYNITITIKNPQLKSAFKAEQEKYHLNITDKQAKIQSQTYVGFIRGLETFYQTLSCTENRKLPCKFESLPIVVEDYPEFQYRGLMIDTSRHFLPVELILETIDAMMYNKMNVLHWHISDDDSFPLLLKSHPELAKAAAFDEQSVYTVADVKKIVHYGLVRGVRIIPELPTPSHSASWVKSQQYSEIKGCQKWRSQAGSFNFFNNKTLSLVKEVFQQIFQLFPDPIVHLGGESVTPQCIQKITSLLPQQNFKKLKQNLPKDSTKQNQQPDHNTYSIHYRQEQRKILKKLNGSKIFMYWEGVNFQGENDDIVHWTGKSTLKQSKNKIVITKQMSHHLDNGVGDSFGNHKGQYSVWTHVYNDNIANQIQKLDIKDNVLGSEVVLWGETSNQYTHHIKIWMRASAMAERLWNSKIKQIRYSVWKRLARFARIMGQRGIPHAPITCQQCEYHPEAC